MNRADLEHLDKTLRATIDWHTRYDEHGGYFESSLQQLHDDALRNVVYALVDLAGNESPQPAPLETVERCQRVPDHCNKIMWKGRYIRLRIKPVLRAPLDEQGEQNLFNKEFAAVTNSDIGGFNGSLKHASALWGWMQSAKVNR